MSKLNDCENVEKNDSEEEVIAKSWAYKMSRMKSHQRIWAEKFINDILTEGELNTLHRHSVSINQNSTSKTNSTTIIDCSEMWESNNKRKSP